MAGAARWLAAAAVALFLIAGADPAAAQPRVLDVYVPAVDYPADLTPETRQRRVELRYALAEDGSVSECRIARSSGQPRLDEESCRILRERAVLVPTRRRNPNLRFIWLWDEQPPEHRPEPGDPLPISPLEWLSSDDYPPTALAAGHEGTVVYSARVSDRGRALDCTVIESSGSPHLDARTCEIIMGRACFIPASDGAGGRREGTFRGSIQWRRW